MLFDCLCYTEGISKFFFVCKQKLYSGYLYLDRRSWLHLGIATLGFSAVLICFPRWNVDSGGISIPFLAETVLGIWPWNLTVSSCCLNSYRMTEKCSFERERVVLSRRLVVNMNYTQMLYFKCCFWQKDSKGDVKSWEANVMFWWFCKLSLGRLCLLQAPCIMEKQKDFKLLFKECYFICTSAHRKCKR